MATLPGVRWALFFLGFSCLSLLWSNTVSVSDSVVYWCALAADFTIVAMLLRAEPFTDASESLMRGFVWGALAMSAIAWIMPAEPDLRLGDEELLGPNNIGYVCAFALFFAQYLMRQNKAKLGIPAFGLAVTLLRTLSKTTIAAFLIGEGFLLLRDKSISRKSKVFIVLSAVAVLALFWGLFTSYYAIYTNAGNQAQTLSGRFGIWTYFLLQAVQQPLIGHGFDSAWKVIPPFGPDQFEADHAQNELLQQFYAYGAVGLCMFIGIYGGIYRHIRKLMKGPEKTFFLSFLLFIVVRGTADTERFDLSLPLWAILVISVLIEHARLAASVTPFSEDKPVPKSSVELGLPMRSEV
jgi:exopolysaccharide production protein ExoQ